MTTVLVSELDELMWTAFFMGVMAVPLMVICSMAVHRLWLFVTFPLRWKWSIVALQPDDDPDLMARIGIYYTHLAGRFFFVWRDGWHWWWTTDSKAKE